MKKITFILMMLVSSSLLANTWYTDIESAQKVAIATNKLIIVDFWAIWCGPCKKMDRDVWSDKEVQKNMNAFVPLKIDLDTNRQLALKFGVRAIPYVFIIDANGEIVYQSKGYMNKAETLRTMKKYALNTRFMQKESSFFYQNPGYVTALRLSQKYMDYSLYLDKDIRDDILNMSSSYLKTAEKYLDKDQANYKMIQQKIELLEANIDLYEDNYRKLGRYLERKIDEEELRKNNLALYSFLNYCLAKKEGKEKQITQWKKELAATSSGKLYKKRAEKFLALE